MRSTFERPLAGVCDHHALDLAKRLQSALSVSVTRNMPPIRRCGLYAPQGEGGRTPPRPEVPWAFGRGPNLRERGNPVGTAGLAPKAGAGSLTKEQARAGHLGAARRLYRFRALKMRILPLIHIAVPTLRPGTVGAYALAFVPVGVATALRVAIDSYVVGVQYITFAAAIMITTLIAGSAAGLFCVVLSAAAAWFLYRTQGARGTGAPPHARDQSSRQEHAKRGGRDRSPDRHHKS
jgi:hypothetical protein